MPERRSSTNKILIHVPLEIYEEIFGWLQLLYAHSKHLGFKDPSLKPTLSNLSRVCHLFCTLSVPLIFNDVSFVDRSSMDPKKDTWKRHKFYLNIHKDRESSRAFCPLIQSCLFDHYKLSWVMRVVPHLKNLRELYLRKLIVHPELLELLGGLGSLTTLDMRDCGVCIEQSRPGRAAIVLPQLSLTSLKVMKNVFESYSLIISFYESTISASLTTIITDHIHLPAFLVKSNLRVPLNFVTELEISLTGWDAFYVTKFLDQNQSIETLRLLQDFREEEAQIGLPINPKALLRLRALTCPYYLAGNFIPGRRLSHVTILSPWIINSEQQDLSAVIRQSATPIKELEIYGTVLSTFTPDGAFEEVRKLRIGIRDPLRNDLETRELVSIRHLNQSLQYI